MQPPIQDYHSMKEYLIARWKYKNTRFKVNQEGRFFFVKGEWISEELYYQNNSIPNFKQANPPNPDKTHIQ